jgi:hypothetical protein
MGLERTVTVRDVAADFAYQPPTSSSKEICTGSIVGPAGTYIAPNSYDATSGGGAFLTELTAMDTILSVGGLNYFNENGAGFGMRLVVDWVTAPVGSGTIQTQLLTSALSSLSTTVVMMDFTALPLSMFSAGYRQMNMLPRSSTWQRYLTLQIITTGMMSAGAYVAWLGLDVDSEVLGYAEGYSIK